MSLQIALLLAIILFVYPFAIYPALLALLVRPRKEAYEGGEPSDWPPVALVICALNEERIIRQKIENSLALSYPKDKLHIILVSDGSTDATAAIAREYVPAGLHLIERQQRRGKVANLNEVVFGIREEIVVFSDANVIYEPDAIRRLVARLEDPTVGCVSGKVILTNTTKDLRQSEENYYSLEWNLQHRASLLYSMAGADGAMHALRRKLFRPCPNDTVIEDLVIPIGVVRQGYRVVFEPRAVAWESGVTSLKEEFRRRTRIAAGAAQALLRGNGWPRGAPLRFWFIFLSHKALRWLSPLFGVLILALALASWQNLLSQLVLAGFVFLAGAALWRYLSGWSHVLLDAPFYFLFGQIALLWGLGKGAGGKQSVLWTKLDR
jgi:cellulose synthase/poly-beta-1,6-N-acetylglucosamine synthase-like glycosyltransferase